VVITNAGSAKLVGPTVQFAANKHYTICFAVRSAVMRKIKVSMGSSIDTKLGMRCAGSTEFTREVFCAAPASNSNAHITFDIGGPEGTIWIDDVVVLEGNANLFRREFAHGTVIVNAAPFARTVDLGGTYQALLGTQDSAVDNGAAYTSIQIPAWDARILIRPE
jgi:hypothetical protein